MIVGGLWAIARMWPSLARGISSGLAAYRLSRPSAGSGRSAEKAPRTERDAPMQWVGIALAVSVVPLFFVFQSIVGSTASRRSWRILIVADAEE
jgi:uncharacterized oligopeptide transporter (OPT) family protein